MQLKTPVIEKGAAMKATVSCFLDGEEYVATVETENEYLSKLNSELLDSARWKSAKSTLTGDGYIATIF